MRRLALLIAISVAACGYFGGDDGYEPYPPDASVPTGSAANAGNGGIEASPKDHDLELGVLGASLLVVLTPIGYRRRAS